MWVKSRKGGDILHDHDSKACQRVACQLCQQQHRYQVRGTKRTLFLLVERGRPIGKVLIHRWLPECYRQMQQGLTDRVVQRGAYLSRGLSLLRLYRSQECQTQQWKGKYEYQIKQNNGKENVLKHIFQGYILPQDKQSMISMRGYNVENPLGKGRDIS